MRHEPMSQINRWRIEPVSRRRSLAFAYSLIVACPLAPPTRAWQTVSDSRASPISDREIHVLDRVKANVARPFNTSGHKYN